MSTPPKLQVVAFGHDLSEAARAYLLSHGEFTFYKVFVHVDEPENIIRAVEGAMKKMVELGVVLDPSAHVKTIWVLPGMTMAASLLLAGWVGATGQWPSVLFQTKGPRGDYTPVPEQPVIHLGHFKNRVGRKLRSTFFQGVEVIRQEAA